MAQTIKLKRSSVAGNIPGSSDLALGEIAVNTADGALYIKKGDNTIVAVGDNDILHIDTSNGRVGVGTTSPSAELTVSGTIANDAFTIPNSIGTAGQVLKAPSSGTTLTWADESGSSGAIAPSINTMTGDGSTTTLTLSTTPVNENATIITFDGVLQHKSTYSLSGSTITFSTAPANGVAVECIVINTHSIQALEDGDSDTKIQVEETADEDKIRFDTAGTERMIIDASGNVGIGTTSPNQLLEVKGTSGTAATRIHADTITSPRAELEFMRGTTDTFGGDAYTDWKIGTVGATQADFAIISSDTTRGSNERLTIEYDTGNVGIGTTSPDNKFHVVSGAAGEVAQFTGAVENRGLSIRSETNTDASAHVVFNSQSVGSKGMFTFETDSTERLRIDSSGNLLVGRTSASGVDVDGHVLFENGVSYQSMTSNSVQFLNRNGTDGNLLQLYKNGSTVGSIGVDAGYITIGKGDTGLLFQDGGDAIQPRSISGLANRDAAISLGVSGGRFKDLYLSGTLTNNGTGGISIDTSGNVGIGASSPNAALSISKQTTALSGTGNTYGLYLYPTSSGAIYVDAITGSTSNTDLKLRSYNNGTYTQLIGSSSGGTVTTFETGGSERMRIDSSGKVGIGESNPDGLLHLTGDTNANGAELYLQVNNNNTTDNLGAINFGSNVDSTLSKILSGTSGANNSSYLTFSTSSSGSQSEAMRIDSSGALLLNPNNATRGLKITTTQTVAVGDTTTYDTVGAGYGRHIFKTDGTERMRIDSSGNLLVGTTAADSNSLGIGLLSSGLAYAVRDGGTAFIAHRKSSDGEIIQLKKDNVAVGSIGTTAGDIQIGSGDTALRFQASTDAVFPAYSSGGGRGSAINLGLSSVPFKDLYLSGNITVGGTVDGRDIATDGTKLDGIESGATADQTQSDINALAITQVGTISSGTWQGTAIASAYLDSDTAHLSGAQTFSGAKTFSSDITLNSSELVHNNATFGTFDWRAYQGDTGDLTWTVTGTSGAEMTLTSDGSNYANASLSVGGASVITTTNTKTLTNKTITSPVINTGVSGTAILDEDTMSSNSATQLATQQSIKAYVDTQVAGVVDSAPAALDTLNELAAALGDDANFSTTTSTALGNRLRVDTAAQGLTGTQQANAITNLGITATKAELNYVDGVTSNIQTQLDGKQASGSYLTGNQTITLSGDVSGSGTTSIAVTIADDSHNHVISNVDGLQTALDAKLPLAGGTLTGSLRAQADLNYFGLASGNNEGEIIINTGEAGSPQIGFTEHGDASWAIGIDDADNSFKMHGTASNTIPTINNLAIPLFEITTTAGTAYLNNSRIFTDAYHPNADTLTTARTISLTGAVTGSVSFNGSSNVSIATTATADPTLTLSGDASGSATFTNLGNATLSVTVADDSHNHVISNVDGLQTALDAKMPLAGGSFTGDVTFGTGADFGSGVASSTTDLSRHLALWGTTYGFNITSNNINLVSAGTNTLSSTSSILTSKVNHDFSAGIDVTGNITVTGTVDGRDVATDGSKLDGIESGATADQTQSDINALGITQVGTISSGTWQGTAIASAYLDSDTAHLSGTQTFTGNKTFTGSTTLSGGVSLSNSNISGVNAIQMADPGPNEGVTWSNIKIYESPDDLTTNTAGNFQVVYGSTRRLTVNSTGVDVNGALTATTKSFDIDHPSKEGMRLHHGVVEGPEHSVYVRGKSKEKVILLPDYWVDLIHEDSITVQLTAIGKGQDLYVEDIKDNKVYVNGENYFYYIQAERKDVEKFEVEYEV